MLNPGREGFFYLWSETKPPAPLFVMLTVVTAISRYSDRCITEYQGEAKLNMNNLKWANR